MNRGALLLALAAGCAAAPASTEGSNESFNVLFIAIDDLRPELGCYGAEYAQSPHLDAFARTAVLFENHFVQAPSCGPSRFALLTGRSAATTGTLPNTALYQGRERLSALPASAARSLPELFKRNGYRTVQIGKVSHTPDGRVFAYDGSGDGEPELPGAWDEFATPYGAWKRGWGAFFAYANGTHREDGREVAPRSEFVADRDADLPDGLMAEAASEKLREFGRQRGVASGDRPFFLGVGFFKPHLPFVAPAGDRLAIASAEIPRSEDLDRWPKAYTHQSGEFRRYATDQEHRVPETEAERVETFRDYLACVRYVDRQIGKVLATLEDTGLAESTIVVVWGDHGWHLGESGVWGKHTVLERSLCSPLMFRAPGLSSEGRRVQSLAATIDVYPTLIDLCKLEHTAVARPLEGVSLVPLLDGSSSQVRTACAAWFGNAATLRTDEHRLVARRKGDEWTDVQVFRIGASVDPSRTTFVEDPELVDSLLARLPAAGSDRP